MARSRRGRGEGGVRQRADGLWVATISLTVGGKRTRPTVYGRTKAEALAKLRKLQARTPGAADETMTVGAFLRTWLDGIRPSVEPTTWHQYDTHVRLHLTPQLGALRLAALTTAHVSAL